MKFLIHPSPTLRYRNRSIRLTSEGVFFLFLTLLVGVTAINTGNNLLYLLMALMLTLIMISGALSEWCLKGIQIEHRLPLHIFAQDPAACRWVIRNRKRLFPSFTIKVTVQYPDLISKQDAFFTRLLAGSTLFHTTTLVFGHRGLFCSKGYELSTAFPFGLFEKTLSISSPSEVVVYPKLHRLWMVQSGSRLAGDSQEIPKKGRGPALYNLRDYQHGDDSRNIHWKISARQAKLFIQEHEKEEERKVQIWLSNQLPVGARVAIQEEESSDASPPHARAGKPRRSPYPPVEAPDARPPLPPELAEQFEEAVSLAASLVHTFTQKGYGVGLSTLDHEIPPSQGMSHRNRILHHLALMDTLSSKNLPKSTDRLAARLSRSHQLILILPWEDPFWKSRETYFTKVITPSQWRADPTGDLAL
ncbi:MAG: DUF58 domain-containing protein [Nitrospira sp.]|nr:DUF58 domain-containing protein [Nitrospira sp.]